MKKTKKWAVTVTRTWTWEETQIVEAENEEQAFELADEDFMDDQWEFQDTDETFQWDVQETDETAKVDIPRTY